MLTGKKRITPHLPDVLSHLTVLLALFIPALLLAQSPFVTTWKTNEPGLSGKDQIQIPGYGSDYSIAWEEIGNPGNNGVATGDGITTVTFPSPGIYRVSIAPGAGTFYRIAFDDAGDTRKLLSVEQWGDIAWSSMENAFRGCTHLICTAEDLPDLSGVGSMRAMFEFCAALDGPSNIGEWNLENVSDLSGMFRFASAFNQDIGNWNTDKVTNMSALFFSAVKFNQDIGNWNTGQVALMKEMFLDAMDFDQDIGLWNTAQVTDMADMFRRALAFNQNIESWNTSNVVNMSGMFRAARAFNQDIGGWNTEQVSDMTMMFYGAGSFDQPLEDWNTGNVISMRLMFSQATDFNQALGKWNTEMVTDMSGMFAGAIAFNQDIGAWDTEAVTNMSSMFSNASSFNQPVGDWSTRNVTDMSGMFAKARVFNQDIGLWNTSEVRTMETMFFQADSFNQDIRNWNTENVLIMDGMFREARAFNQDIGNWRLGADVFMEYMLSHSGLDCANYSATLRGWSETPDLPEGLVLGADGLEYGLEALQARDFLVSAKGWSIFGDHPSNEDCSMSSSAEDPLVLSAIHLWPNPARDWLNVSAEDIPSDTQMHLLDVTGRVLRHSFLSSGGVDLQGLPPGTYFLLLESSSGWIARKLSVLP